MFNTKRKEFSSGLTLIFCIDAILMSIYYKSAVLDHLKLQKEANFEIKNGENVLKLQTIIRKEAINSEFLYFVRLLNRSDNIQAGTYKIPVSL